MWHSVFFALMVGSPTHPPHLTRIPLAPHTPPACALPPPHPPHQIAGRPSTCVPVQPALPLPLPLPLQHCLLEAACLAAHALPPGRGMDLNPELLSASDMQCFGLVVQCMSQCRVHNLNLGVCSFVQATVGVGTIDLVFLHSLYKGGGGRTLTHPKYPTHATPALQTIPTQVTPRAKKMKPDIYEHDFHTPIAPRMINFWFFATLSPNPVTVPHGTSHALWQELDLQLMPDSPLSSAGSCCSCSTDCSCDAHSTTSVHS